MSSSIRPALRVKRFCTVAVLARAYAVYGGLTADPARFAAPNPPLPAFQGQIAKVEAAYKLSLTRARGTAAACKVERDALYGMLETQRAYVKTLCDAAPEQAAAIVQAAGMEIAATTAHRHGVLEVTRGALSGTVILRAGASILLGGRKGRSKFFEWQSTTDGGRTFHSAPSTALARTTIADLAPLALTGFRVRANTAEGPGAWSPIVSIVVY